MRIVIQRVLHAQVEVDSQTVGKIDHGVLVLLGVGHGDTVQQAQWLATKTAELRIFEDDQGKMNRSLIDVRGAALVVSQFTLLGDCRKGRRPAFTAAAAPEVADQLYQAYCRLLSEQGIEVQRGVFAADMKVSLVNDGPVTLVLDRAPQS
ncbi:MAG: D-aminoacyl-tRNA deacylase [Pirellulales bacterium]|nr:D-aminoacyl-tRNA deacylase [Pirellulales bacterium]